MKKAISFLVVVALLMTMAAGCGKPADNGNVTDKPGASAPNAQPTSIDMGTKATNPSASYSAYITAKSDAYDRITAKMDENEDLYMTLGMSFVAVSFIDLSLLYITALTGDAATSEAVLGSLGMAGVKVTQSGNVYTITYTDPNSGDSVVQTCSYDPATDSMQSSISDGNGTESLFFEYTHMSDGYASQYYYDNGDGTFGIITSYITSDIAAFGMINSATGEPASIIGNNSLTADFVKGGEYYFILEGDKLSVLENGEEKVY